MVLSEDQGDFCHQEAVLDQREKKKKICRITVSLLTVSRMFLTVCFIQSLYLWEERLYLSGGIFLLIALTDVVDGKLARKWEVQSHLGAILDVGADFFFLEASSVALFIQNRFPLWMIFVTGFKFGEFILTSHILRARGDSKGLFAFDLLGRRISVLFYILPLGTLFLEAAVSSVSFGIYQKSIFLCVAGLALISSVYRILLCRRK